MVRQRTIDRYSHVIILQVSALGDLGFSFSGFESRKLSSNLPTLGEYLSEYYPLDFRIKLYNAAQFSVCDPEIREIEVRDLIIEGIKGIATLYIPPIERTAIHLEMLDKYEMRQILDGWRLIPLNSRPDNGVGKFCDDSRE